MKNTLKHMQGAFLAAAVSFGATTAVYAEKVGKIVDNNTNATVSTPSLEAEVDDYKYAGEYVPCYLTRDSLQCHLEKMDPGEIENLVGNIKELKTPSSIQLAKVLSYIETELGNVAKSELSADLLEWFCQYDLLDINNLENISILSFDNIQNLEWLQEMKTSMIRHYPGLAEYFPDLRVFPPKDNSTNTRSVPEKLTPPEPFPEEKVETLHI